MADEQCSPNRTGILCGALARMGLVYQQALPVALTPKKTSYSWNPTTILKYSHREEVMLFCWNLNAQNTNSDNMWFPMPPDRAVYITVYTSCS